MNRRKFLLNLVIAMSAPIYSNADITSNGKFKVDMNGPLDDDLFIIKYNLNGDFKVQECFQMHNPSGKFYHDGKVCVSEHIPGYIDYNNTHEISKDNIVLICTANEREDFYDTKKLHARTHYKSCRLNINNETFFPSLLPEHEDVKNYPLWYGKDEDKSSYNYYQLWENSVVNTGLLFPDNSEREIILLSDKNAILSKAVFVPTEESKRILFNKVAGNKINTRHLFAEIDGTVFSDGKNMNDAFIKENAVSKMFIKNKTLNEETLIVLPYPTAYINSIYTKLIRI